MDGCWTGDQELGWKQYESEAKASQELSARDGSASGGLLHHLSRLEAPASSRAGADEVGAVSCGHGPMLFTPRRPGCCIE